MDRTFWLERWDAQDIGFHQADFEPALDKYWRRLELHPGARVFVPLCGKSLDMVWLAKHGHAVVGSEISERAVDDFFAERDVVPKVRRVAGFTIKSSGPYEIWCGDFFELPRSAVTDVAAVYDRAALIALPAEMQMRYAENLRGLLPTAPIMLITVDYDQRQMQGPPFATPKRVVNDLFADRYACTELVTRDVLEGHPHFKQRGLTALQGAVYLLHPR